MHAGPCAFLLHACRHYAAEALLEDADLIHADVGAGREPGTAAPDASNSTAAALAERRASHAKTSTASAGAKARTARAASSSSSSSSSKQTILDDSAHPIRRRDIPRGVWTVLLRLRGAGLTSLGSVPACGMHAAYRYIWVVVKRPHAVHPSFMHFLCQRRA